MPSFFAYPAILLTSIAGLANAPLWTVLIGAGVLLSISIREHRHYATRLAQVKSLDILSMLAWQSAGHAILASGVAYGLGVVGRIVMQS